MFFSCGRSHPRSKVDFRRNPHVTRSFTMSDGEGIGYMHM
jgi:hypothetical protein